MHYPRWAKSEIWIAGGLALRTLHRKPCVYSSQCCIAHHYSTVRYVSAGSHLTYMTVVPANSSSCYSDECCCSSASREDALRSSAASRSRGRRRDEARPRATDVTAKESKLCVDPIALIQFRLPCRASGIVQ